MKNHNKSTILLVDDRPANVLALEKLLETNDRVFLKASSGGEALKLALNREIDLIILDVQMPEMDGFEVSRDIKIQRAYERHPHYLCVGRKKSTAS